MQYLFRISAQAIGRIVKQISIVIFSTLKDEYMPIPNKEAWLKTAEEYFDYRQIPNCLGSLDGKHVRLQKPAKSGSLYHNFKGFSSLVLLACVDANYAFTCIDVGAVGSANDSAIFKNSDFGKLFFKNKLKIPPANCFPGGSSEKMPYFFIADEAFPITTHLMRPFSGKSIAGNPAEQNRKETYNYRLSRARINVECAFGGLRSKFRVYDTPIKTNMTTSIQIVKATCMLHNYIRQEDRPHVNETEIAAEFRASRLTRRNLQDLQVQQCGNATSDGQYVREYLSKYFLSIAGAVPWQNRRVNPRNFN